MHLGMDIRDGKVSYAILQKIAVFYLAVWSISPPLMIGTVNRLVALACVVVWFALALLRGLTFKPIHCVALFFTLAVVGIAYIQYNSIGGVLKLISIYMLVIGFLMAYFYRGRWHELEGLIPILLILYVLWNVQTIQALIEDPSIARQIVRDDEAIYDYLRRGIGGYELIYPQVCVWPAVAVWIFQAIRTKRWVQGVIGLVWATTYVWLLFLAGYSIAICATLLGLILLLFYKGKHAITALLIALALFIAGAMILLYVEPVQTTLLTWFDGTAVADKINDLVATDATGESVGSILSRVKRYRATLQGLLDYPVIGSLWVFVGGGHSALFDTFCRYGWWGGAAYAMVLYYTPNYYKKILTRPIMQRAATAVLVSLAFVTVLDTVTYSFAFMITVVLSLFFESIDGWDEIRVSKKKKRRHNRHEIYYMQSVDRPEVKQDQR